MTAVIALVASAAVAVGVIGGPSSGPARGLGQGRWAGGVGRVDDGLGPGPGLPRLRRLSIPAPVRATPEPGPAMMQSTRFTMMRAGGGAGPVDSTKAREIANFLVGR